MKTQVASASQQPPSAKVSAMPARKLQRKCACGSHSDSGEMCAECEGQKKLQRQAGGSMTPTVAPGIVHEVLRSPGQPLEGATRGFMESRFGHDFSKVRVHTDAQAGESARAVDAHAFTVGRHVVFGTGQYRTGSASGKRLLAHELAHVVQQRSQGEVGTGDRLEIGPPHDRFEHEADALAVSTAEGRTFPARSSMQSPSRLQRFSFGEFFSQIPILGPLLSGRAFGAENYTREELLHYYTEFVSKGRLENHYDSDNKARAVVRLWITGDREFQLAPRLKRVLVKEMGTGHVSDDDEQGILDILQRSEDEDLHVIFGAGGVNPKSLFEDFGKAGRKRLQAFYDLRFKGSLANLEQGVIETTGAPDLPGLLNDRTFREKWERALEKALGQLAERNAAGGCTFPRPDERTIDDENWRPFQTSRDKVIGHEGFTPRHAAPYDAVELLFRNLDKWTCDCRLYPEIALLFAWREALIDSPPAFNKKFAGLVLSAEGTTGLDREVVNTEEDAQWKQAPVGTKVVWQNDSPAARVPWTHEHAIKRFKGAPGEDDRYDAHPLGVNLTEAQVKDGLARNCSDFPWVYKITPTVLTTLRGEGLAPDVLKSLTVIQGQPIVGLKQFLDTEPLLNLRKQAKTDPPRFSKLINGILKQARLPADAPESKLGKPEDYVTQNIRRTKIELMK